VAVINLNIFAAFTFRVVGSILEYLLSGWKEAGKLSTPQLSCHNIAVVDAYYMCAYAITLADSFFSAIEKKSITV